MTSPAMFLTRHYPFPGDVGKRLYRSREWTKTKNGGATVAKLRALATVWVQKGHIRVYRDILP